MASEMLTRYNRLRLTRRYGHHRAVRELGLQTGLDLGTVARVIQRARIVEEQQHAKEERRRSAG